jgi:hypothetical protein
MFHEAPHTVAQLYGLPNGILHIFNTIFYENEFQNPQIFQQTISLLPEKSTLVTYAQLYSLSKVILFKWPVQMSQEDIP